MIRGTLLVSIGLALGFALSWVLDSIWREGETPRKVKDAINTVKMGDYAQGRIALENNLPIVDRTGILVLADLYALGLGGSIEEQKAITLMQLLECGAKRKGSDEFSFAKNTRFKDRSLGTRWLIRAAELGNIDAIELLASSDKLNAEGFDPNIVLTGGWGGMKVDHSLDGLREKLKCE